MAVVTIARKDGHHLAGDHDDWIVEMYVAGFSLGFIGRYFGISADTVRRRLARREIPIRPRLQQEVPDRLSHREMERTRFMYERLEMSTGEIGALLGLSRSAVQYRLHRGGIRIRTRHEAQLLAYRRGRKPRPQRRPRRPHERIGTRYDKQIVRLYKEGRNQAYIEKLLDLPHGSVRRRLTARGVPIRPRKGIPLSERKLPLSEFERTASLYREGMSPTEIAQRLGLSVTTVRYRLRVAGVTIRGRSEAQRVLAGRRRIEAARARKQADAVAA